MHGIEIFSIFTIITKKNIVYMENFKIAGLVKCIWDDEVYAKVVFIYDGRYWLDEDNQGDVKLADIDPSWISGHDEDYCWDTGISADVALADCGNEILDMWKESIYDEQDVDCYPLESTFCIEY